MTTSLPSIWSFYNVFNYGFYPMRIDYIFHYECERIIDGGSLEFYKEKINKIIKHTQEEWIELCTNLNEDPKSSKLDILVAVILDNLKFNLTLTLEPYFRYAAAYHVYHNSSERQKNIKWFTNEIKKIVEDRYPEIMK